MFLDHQTSKNPSTNNLNNQTKERPLTHTEETVDKVWRRKKLRNTKDKLILLLTQTKEPRV